MKKNMKKPASVEVAEPEKPKFRKLTTLGEMRAVFERKIDLQFEFDGQQCEIEARRLSPAESARISDMLVVIVPPLVKGRTQDDDRFDVTNPDYVKKKSAAALQARAMGIYTCVPAIKADFDAKHPAAEVGAVTDFVQQLFNDQVLELIWSAVRDGGVKTAEIVNFI